MTLGGVAPGLAVGIDVVDLDDPRSAGKADDARFLRRILTAHEALWVQGAPQRDLALWALWAGKEAAYKTVTLLQGRAPVFHHAAFEVWLPRDVAEGGSGGHVRYGSLVLPLWLLRTGPCLVGLSWDPRTAGGQAADPADIHAPAGLPATVRWAAGTLDGVAGDLEAGELDLEGLRDHRLSPAEARAVHSRPSALVRLAARQTAARVLDAAEDRLAVICAEGAPGRVPPALHLDGTACAHATVSLSHHGAWLGWAVRASGDGSAAAG